MIVFLCGAKVACTFMVRQTLFIMLGVGGRPRRLEAAFKKSKGGVTPNVNDFQTIYLCLCYF